jgi:cyclic pyranopterin phosphate synthase
MNKLTHTNPDGKANMVDVAHKTPQIRIATATGHINLQPETIELIRDNQLRKGDVLTLAEIAGIQAAKRTAELIPLCHPILTTKIEVQCQLLPTGIQAQSLVKCIGQTGVEMEALTAVNIALLTVYDMCKAVDKQMEINQIRLTDKQKHDL